jgi:hypothetical protein
MQNQERNGPLLNEKRAVVFWIDQAYKIPARRAGAACAEYALGCNGDQLRGRFPYRHKRGR